MDMASNSLARLPVSSSPCDEVPHMFTRKPRLQPGKFLNSGAKRLLQHNLPGADVAEHDRCSLQTLPAKDGSQRVRGHIGGKVARFARASCFSASRRRPGAVPTIRSAVL